MLVLGGLLLCQATEPIASKEGRFTGWRQLLLRQCCYWHDRIRAKQLLRHSFMARPMLLSPHWLAAG